jgi:DHA3 family macrolide efflux protein-like MFS transporter
MTQENLNPSTTQPEKQGWKVKFFAIWTGQLFSLLGSSLVQFALVWYLTKTTGSAAVLAGATIAAILPEIILGPFVGALVDRWNRRMIMILADAMIALCTAVLVLLFYLNQVEVWQIYVLVFMRSLGSAFHWPAMQASTSLLVPEQHLARVAGINQAVRGIIAVAAPPLGALLMDLLPMYSVLMVDIVTAFFAILPLLFVSIPQPKGTTTIPLTSPVQLWHEVLEGIRFMRNWPGAIALMFIATFINFLLAPSDTLLPLLVKDHFNGGAWQLSFVASSMGVGFVIGGLTLGVWGGFKRKIVTSLTGVCGIGVGVVIMGLAPSSMLWVAILGAAFLGIMVPIANGPLHALLQAKVPHEMQGRIFTLISSLAMATMPLSMLIAAPIADQIGVQAWYLIGGVATLLVGIGSMMNKSIMHMEDIESANAREAALASE